MTAPTDPLDDQTADLAAKPVTPDETVELPSQSAPLKSAGSTTTLPPREPETLGRYKVMRILGSGGYGVVYLGVDEMLERVVAIKVPRPEKVAGPELVEAYLKEARLVANLEHPAIVRVYDCGLTDDNRCYVISQYIDGGDLSDWLKGNKATWEWSVALIIRISDALHHAHRNRIVHRDVKPSNILLDGSGIAFLADFGLALRDADYGRGSGYAGTPRYMSPEQARGEGHRVDGRSDLYSLGVVLYELLTGSVPFVADSITGLLDQIQTREPSPLRLHAEDVPAELDRIVQKALSKRAADRHDTLADFADDLKTWQMSQTVPTLPHSPAAAATPHETPGSTRISPGETRPPRVVPKGLRAFDANDADFFLRLLPGPRDRDGLPESLRFWKHRLDDPASGLTVGLLYGPSGCGKSSFVRAGLLPRLAANVITVVLDATPQETERKLLQTLQQRFPKIIKPVSTLNEALLNLRKHVATPVVLVFDQFEQWLAAHPDPDAAELTLALRQCDGEHVRALLLIRDDFWMAATRFFQALEIPLQEKQNSAAVDLFDAEHARRVLAGFGRAFNRLPAKKTEYSVEQNQFLDAAVAGLAGADGRVVCVRLAIFAEMTKSRPWTLSTLKSLGGLDGIGVTYLEEAFGPTAAPGHRLHEAAARGVLAALLPAAGSDLKKTQAPRALLVKASGYEDRPADFDVLMKILDEELRMVTVAEAGHYQLTHDFLVPSLREWLTRKQKSTRRGRAELLLAERAAQWKQQPTRRHQPGPLEWLRIGALTRRRSWNDGERRMMRVAGMRYAMQTLAALVLIGVSTFVIVNERRKQHDRERMAAAKMLVDQVVTADPLQLPLILRDLKPLRDLADPLLTERMQSAQSPELKSKLELVSVADDPARLSAVVEALPRGTPLGKVGLHLLLDTPECDAFVLIEILRTAEPEEIPRLVAKIGSDPNATDQLRRFAVFLQGAAVSNSAGDVLQFPTGAAAIESAMPQLLSKYRTKARADQENASGKARIILALAMQGDPQWLATGFQDRQSVNLPAHLLTDAAGLGADVGILVTLLTAANTPELTRHTVLALGQYKVDRIAEATRTKAIDAIIRIYEAHPDAGVHAACEYTLRNWGLQDKISRHHNPIHDTVRRWHVNHERQVFTLFPETTRSFGMGALPGETDRLDDRNGHRRTIPRAFMIGRCEITAGEFQRCDENYKPDKLYGNHTDCPATSLNWYDAAMYCRWLTQRENFPESQQCFVLDEQGNPQLAPDYLDRTGYRLPTEAEWEFAARGGNGAARHYGNADRLLGHFAWHAGNGKDRLHPVGQLMPNEYGLFDMLGNASEWTMNNYPDSKAYPPPGGTAEDVPSKILTIDPEVSRIVRGGAFYMEAADLRSARRFASPAQTGSASIGFRLARTIKPPQP